MQTSRTLIQKYYHVRVGHKLAGIIAQVDTVSLMAARLLGCDFCAVFYRAENNTRLIPVSYQYGSHLSIRGLDVLESTWAEIDTDTQPLQRGLHECSQAKAQKGDDPFGVENGFACRYMYPVYDEGRLCAVIIGYWYEQPRSIDRNAEIMLDLVAAVLKAALEIADQLMVVENYSTRLSEMLPVFEIPLQEVKFSELVTDVVSRASNMCPGAHVFLLSRGNKSGKLQCAEIHGDTTPSPELIAFVTKTVEPMTQIDGEDPDGDTGRYRCRDLAFPESLELTDLVALPIAPVDDLQFVLVVCATSERGLSANDRELLSVYAVFAQTVLRNALLVKRLRRANRLLEHSSDRLANAETMAALTDMTSGVAHDFNNIFGAIIGRVQLLRIRAKDNQMVADELTKIEKLVGEGAETVRRIQEFTTSGRAKEVRAFDLVATLQEALAAADTRWKKLAETRNVTVDFDCRIDKAIVEGCHDDLLTVVRKLLENAVEHAPENSAVSVLLEADDRNYRLVVTDHGSGIAPDLRKRIFYPFFTTKSERGAGLGLAIVHGIISRHSGSVSLSCSPETGTAFTVTLSRPATISDVTEVTTRRSVRAENLRILIVDDDDQIREVLRDMLMINGHRATACADGFEALKVIAKDTFDLMITDLGMPGMSGLELAGTVHDRLPALPIAMITGWGTQLDQREIAAKGIRAVLPKPFHLKDIRALVEDMATA